MEPSHAVIPENEIRDPWGAEFARCIDDVLHALQSSRHVSLEVAFLAVDEALLEIADSREVDFFRFTPNSALSAMHFLVTFLPDEFRDALTTAADERIGSLCRHQATS